MTQCYQNAIEFPRVRRRVVEARFNGGELTSDGGSLLLRQADRYRGLTDAVHGEQTGRFFHGFYRRYCFLPLYVFCRWKLLRWCDRHDVDYIVGVAKNDRLNALTAEAQRLAAEAFEHTGEKVRRFTDIHYGARTRDRPRRVIAKLEHTRGAPPRYVVTSLEGDAQALYDRLYCARGDMENRIKEQQLDLFADRTSCHHWWAKQFRLLKWRRWPTRSSRRSAASASRARSWPAPTWARSD